MRIILEALDGKALHILAPHRLAAWYHVIGLALLEGGVDRTRAIGLVRRDPPRPSAQRGGDRVDPLPEPARVVFFARHDLDIDHQAGMVIDGGVLLVARAQRCTGRGRHGGVGIAAAELLVFSRRSRLALVIVGVLHGFEVLIDKRVHADVGADQRGVHVDSLGRDQPGLRTVLHDPRENLAKQGLSPPLADTRERGMIGERLMKAIPGEPTDREIDLSFAHQPPVLHDPKNKPGQHQPYCDFRIYPGTATVRTVKPGHLRMQPTQIEYPIDTDKNMVVGQEIPQRPRNEKLQLISVPCWPPPSVRRENCPPRTVFRPGSLLKPDLQWLAVRVVWQGIGYARGDVF